uniref:Ankyrin repeat domain 61 n=1 Tax=Kryptolebias marmoratus TaxID=37003 RepID=A0A3Q3AJJ4_KRYMA
TTTTSTRPSWTETWDALTTCRRSMAEFSGSSKLPYFCCSFQSFAVLPLHLAASYRRAQSMRSLLSAGADAEVKDRLGRTPLHLVIIDWPTIQTSSPKSTSKLRAAETCLRLLCEHGVNVNAQVRGHLCHQTALHLSVRYRAPSAVQILSSYGADVNAVDASGMTPLHMAAGTLLKDITASLIKLGADINKMQHSGNTPLHLAVVAMATKASKASEDDIRCVSELLQHGARPDLENKAGLSPLHQACSMGKEELLDLLLAHGADVNKRSEAGESCLFLFLNRRPNLRNHALLMKLLTLTSPLTLYNQDGCLPLTLTQPRFSKQRDQLLRLIQQPRTLQGICKRDIYLKCVGGRKEDLRKVLPESLFEFVFDHWAIQHISFQDGEHDSVQQRSCTSS